MPRETLASNTVSMRAPHHITHPPAPLDVRSWAGRGVRAAGSTGLPQGPLRRPFIWGQPLFRQSHLFPKNRGTCPTFCRHLLSLFRSWERQAPLSSLHLCSDLSSGSMLISESAAHTRVHTYLHIHICTHTHSTPSPSPSFHMVFSTFWQNWSTSSPASWVENQEQRLHSLWTTNISSNSIFDLRCTPQSLVTWCLPK